MRLALKALVVVGLSLVLTGCHTYGHHGHGYYYDRALYSDPDEADLYDAAFYEDFNQELAQTWASGYGPAQEERLGRPGYVHRPGVGGAMSGTIGACISAQDQNGRWGPDEPVRVTLYDGYGLGQMGIRAPNNSLDELHVLINWGRGRITLIPLGTRPGLSTAATVLQDTEGNSWRISRTWRRCSF